MSYSLEIGFEHRPENLDQLFEEMRFVRELQINGIAKYVNKDVAKCTSMTYYEKPVFLKNAWKYYYNKDVEAVGFLESLQSNRQYCDEIATILRDKYKALVADMQTGLLWDTVHGNSLKNISTN